ncbi:MAG: hypothetical protein IMF14_07100, partial [Proteobacteria bacterium]|nr:hypothetical protein [Pseudomonadota bacterium]
MSKKRLTLQTSLAIAILLIGAIGVALVMSTDNTYRRLAFEQQQASVSQLIAIKSADLLKKLGSLQQDLGLKLQDDDNFKQALLSKNKKDITYWLDQEFNR